jgi:hypothetical protein
MKRKQRAFFGMVVPIQAAAVSTLLMITLAGCGNDGPANPGFLLNLSNLPIVTSVTVSPNSSAVAKGGTETFTAVVAGTNSPAQTVTWTVSGNTDAGTTISAGGVLTVASAEAYGTSLTITATSTADTSKSGTAKVLAGYLVGNTGPAGGKIFYVDSTDIYPGFKYLEAAPANASGSSLWVAYGSTYDSTEMGGTYTAIGSGKANTDTILAADPAAPAAKACKDYNHGGYTDWFLPSLDELKEIYTHRGVIGTFSTTNKYCSSSERSNNHVWFLDFSTGGWDSNYKSNGYFVRPIRAF